MPSGQQKAKINKEVFDDWVNERYITNDWPSYVRRNKLNRSEIAKECGFSLSVLRQNPQIKAALVKLENKLRDKGILNSIDNSIKSNNSNIREKTARRRLNQRLNQIEQKNQSLRAENENLKATLKEFNLFDKYLLETGRVPR